MNAPRFAKPELPKTLFGQRRQSVSAIAAFQPTWFDRLRPSPVAAAIKN
jgi:hypothetical protein